LVYGSQIKGGEGLKVAKKTLEAEVSYCPNRACDIEGVRKGNLQLPGRGTEGHFSPAVLRMRREECRKLIDLEGKGCNACTGDGRP